MVKAQNVVKQNKCVRISGALEIKEIKLGEGEKPDSKEEKKQKGQ